MSQQKTRVKCAYVVTWTNNAGARRSVAFADEAMAQACAVVKRKLRLPCDVKPTTIRL